MNEEGNYSLLRPFDLEAARRGEPLIFYSASDGFFIPVKFVAEGGENGFHVVRREDGNLMLGEDITLRAAPLCWVEGKPVYKGDVLWHISAGRSVADSFIGEYLLLNYDRWPDDPPGATALDRITWTRPETSRIVCAANRACLTGDIALGARHFDSIMRMQMQQWKDPHALVTQGFVDQQGKFLTRTEAWKVAEAAGQIIRRCGGDDVGGGTLYSENLY